MLLSIWYCEVQQSWFLNFQQLFPFYWFDKPLGDHFSVMPLLFFQALSSMEQFRNLDREIEGSAKRWKKFVESECPEKEKFPQEWKNKSALQHLCMMRALRPDRMTYAVR